MAIRELMIDGELSGTGVRDPVNGGDLSPRELGLSADLQTRIDAWLDRYAEVHYGGFSDMAAISLLDEEGLSIRDMVAAQLKDVAVSYFSHGLVKRLG